jgi:cysteine-rich repeat protein
VPDTCGDQIVDIGEDCDDGNADNSDSCTNACRFARCGDGVLWLDSQGGSFEQCDDGNKINGDGCSSQCVFESCGDGFFDPGEDCDDGPGGSCPDTCRDSECGSGCALGLCGKNEVCAKIGVVCDGSPASECVGHCMLWVANCAMVAGFPKDPAAVDLVNCVGACLLIP